ncbi:hypothetical protein QCA50_004223 [Cerrena zonata]|uniref:PPM-type phosphatase domain-containing protein n=1 Tax=Cerrena zonata TaxID=2478898 RepID=A0AAW0GRI5_9APHY
MSPVPTDSSPNVAPISQHVTAPSNDASLPSQLSFKCAVTDEKGPRRFMEDAHSIVVPFAGVRGQGFFAIFDGHAGKQAAEWCGQNFSLRLLETLRTKPNSPIPDVLNYTFHDVDTKLSKMTEESDGKMHSGCTAVTAFLRLEDADGKQSFLPPSFDPFQSSLDMIEAGSDESDSNSHTGGHTDEHKKKSSKSKIKNAFRHIGGSSRSSQNNSSDASSSHSNQTSTPSPTQDKDDQIYTPVTASNIRRVLYCANAGDARGVLCRSGKAVRLTYDHKGTDKQEAKRIVDAGGFVMSGRVNGVLAVTRSLGDSSMKEFVVGAPYTTETELSEEDEFLILACDGLWDVLQDQEAVAQVRHIADPAEAAKSLMDQAYAKYSTDNVTVLVIRFRNPPS